MYRKAVCTLIQKEDQFLLVHKTGDEQNVWYVPSGGIEPGETREEAIIRELYEELGILKEHIVIKKVSSIKQRFEWDEETAKKTGFIGQEQEIIFIELKKYKFNLTITDELDDFKWVTKKELFTEIPYENFKETLNKVFTT
ncbi:NUDIX hydrolase [Candidatus Woesearchaeota archaeon]|nr:NUDIX hydrolase [Candidatus Woesearchaeota archaeon]